MTSQTKIWFISGTSRGFGRAWAEAALSRGDRVAATARDISALRPLVERFGSLVLPVRLDVRDREAARRAVTESHAHFGRLDVVVNNAGHGLFGMVEEASEQQARDQFDTNFFGAMWITQAALPLLRAQRSGHIVQVSSIGGVMAFPFFGVYNASKWALEAMSQALAAEVKDFGIKVTLVEPTAYATEWAGSSAVKAESLPVYDRVRAHVLQTWAAQRPGMPAATAAAMMKLVDAQDPPLRAFFGRGLLDMMRAEYASRLDGWAGGEELAQEAVGPQAGD